MSSGTKVRQLAARWLLGVLGKLGFVFWVETFFFRLESRSQLLFRVPGRFTCWHWEASGNTETMETVQTMKTVQKSWTTGKPWKPQTNHGNHGNHGNRKEIMETVETMETMETAKKS